jgi:hypothetical protein
VKLNDKALMKIVKHIGDNILQKAHDDKNYNILDSHIDLMDYLQKLEFNTVSVLNKELFVEER